MFLKKLLGLEPCTCPCCKRKVDAKIDLASNDSFPASDPPPWGKPAEHDTVQITAEQPPRSTF